MVLMMGVWLGYQSDRGYLMVLTTLVNCITMLIWVPISPNAILVFLALLVANAFLSYFKDIRYVSDYDSIDMVSGGRAIWTRICTSAVLITTLILMVIVRWRNQTIYWIGDSNDVNLTLWFASLTFLPSAIFNR